MVHFDRKILIVYRGMKMAKDQIEKFKENEGKLVSISGFFTANTFRSTALNQAMKPSKQTGLSSVLLKIQCDLQHLNNGVVVTNSCEEQQEILFNSTVTYRLKNVRMEDEIYFVEMSASNDGQIIKEKYINDSRRQIEDLSIKILFGRLMCDIGQWNQSQHFFEILLNNWNNNNEDLAKIERSLGEVLQWKGEWNEARKCYDRAYDRIMNAKPIRIKELADILFDIGEILYLEG
ncbi:unnamed protein product, partial [Rotaria sp. Silwood1]